MARTLSLRQVGFDGLFRRISHKEFFLDGLGRLKIAHCSNLAIGKNQISFFLIKISLGHNHQCLTPNQRKNYMSFREPGAEELDFIDRTWFMRSNLQCISEHKGWLLK